MMKGIQQQPHCQGDMETGLCKPQYTQLLKGKPVLLSDICSHMGIQSSCRQILWLF